MGVGFSFLKLTKGEDLSMSYVVSWSMASSRYKYFHYIKLVWGIHSKIKEVLKRRKSKTNEKTSKKKNVLSPCLVLVGERVLHNLTLCLDPMPWLTRDTLINKI